MMMMMMTRKEMVGLVAGRRDIASWDGNRLPWVGLSTWSVSRPYRGSIGRRVVSWSKVCGRQDRGKRGQG